MEKTCMLGLLLTVVVCEAQLVELPPLIAPFANVEGNWHSLVDGVRFTLECMAKGEPKPELQWFKDDQPFEPQDGMVIDESILDFSDPRVDLHQGRYFCEATNKLGKAKSGVILVSPFRPKSPEWAISPNFTVKPEVEIKEVDSFVEFKCDAVGSPKPEIIWTKNAEVLPDFTDKNVLTIDRVSKQDIGTYACNVSNLAGYDYKMVYLNILTQSPIFLESPRNRTVSINQEVFLRCSAKGYPIPSLEWRFNGNLIDVEADPELEQNDRGDLVIKRVQNETAGFYECLAKNVHGEVKEVGYLKVVSKTTIERGPVDMTAEIRSQVTMECSVVWDPSFELSIQWKKDNVDVKMGGRFSQGSDNSLVIEDLIFDDAGTYTCVASTNQGSSTDSGTLTVIGIQPSLVSGPVPQTVTEESTILINCSVDGFPKPEHSWFNDTDRIYFDHRKPERVSMNGDGGLIIEDAQLTDSNKYICRASNGYGTPVVESAFIDVRVATKVIKGPEHQKFVLGQNYSFDCLVEVDDRLKDDLNVTWMKNEQPVDVSHERYEMFDNNTLSIVDTSEEDIGEYQCHVVTLVDQVLISATIYDDQGSWWWLILLIVLLCIILIVICCLICCVRKRSKNKGRYGVKDIEDGKAKHNKSDIHYSINDDTDSIHNDLLDDNEKKKPIFTPSTNPLLNDLKGSENSLLNLTDEELWLRKGMDEDGSFREGRYAD